MHTIELNVKTPSSVIPSRTDQKQILILGGTGVTGKLIMGNLLSGLKGAEITAGSRRGSVVQQGVKNLSIDLYDQADAIKKLSLFDLVIIAVGPFKTFGNLPHRLCIQAGVDCIDVNDSIAAAVDIYQLDQEARRRGVKVLTGMGLNPGLSTVMLLSLLAQAPTEHHQASMKLFIGGRQEVGYAAAQVISNVLSPSVAVIRKGKCAYVPANDGYPEQSYVFPGMKAPVQMIHRSTPQCYTLARNGSFENLQTLDFSIHFQGFSFLRLQLIKLASWFKQRAVAAPLINFTLGLQQVLQNKQANEPNSVVVVQTESTHGRKWKAYCTGMTSYEMTAKFTAVIAEMLLSDSIIKPAGVMGMEDNIVNQREIMAALRKRGIRIGYLLEPITGASNNVSN